METYLRISDEFIIQLISDLVNNKELNSQQKGCIAYLLETTGDAEVKPVTTTNSQKKLAAKPAEEKPAKVLKPTAKKQTIQAPSIEDFGDDETAEDPEEEFDFSKINKTQAKPKIKLELEEDNVEDMTEEVMEDDNELPDFEMEDFEEKTPVLNIKPKAKVMSDEGDIPLIQKEKTKAGAGLVTDYKKVLAIDFD